MKKNNIYKLNKLKIELMAKFGTGSAKLIDDVESAEKSAEVVVNTWSLLDQVIIEDSFIKGTIVPLIVDADADNVKHVGSVLTTIFALLNYHVCGKVSDGEFEVLFGALKRDILNIGVVYVALSKIE